MKRYDPCLAWDADSGDQVAVLREARDGEFARFADVEHLRITHANTIDTLQRSLRQFEVANRAAALIRVPAEIKEAAAAARRNEEGVQAANALLTEEVDALKAEVERSTKIQDSLSEEVEHWRTKANQAAAEVERQKSRLGEELADRQGICNVFIAKADALAADNARLRAALRDVETCTGNEGAMREHAREALGEK